MNLVNTIAQKIEAGDLDVTTEVAVAQEIVGERRQAWIRGPHRRAETRANQLHPQGSTTTRRSSSGVRDKGLLLLLLAIVID